MIIEGCRDRNGPILRLPPYSGCVKCEYVICLLYSVLLQVLSICTATAFVAVSLGEPTPSKEGMGACHFHNTLT